MNDMIKITYIDGTNFLTSLDYTTEKMTELIDESSKQMPERKLSYKVFKSGEMPLEELPEPIQAQVKSVLRAYPRSTYNWDHFVAGMYKDNEVYTLEERRQNFKEEFGYAPFF